MNRRLAFSHRQRGIATLLIILVVGIAVSVSVLGVLHEMKSTQDRQLSLHAQSASQAKVWRLSETVRRYLATLDNATLAQWSQQGHPIALQLPGDGTVGVQLSQIQSLGAVDSTTQRYRVTGQLRATAAARSPSKASALLEVVYEVDAHTTSQQTPPPSTPGGTVIEAVNAFNIYRDLNMTGGIKIIGGKAANFNVVGNVTLDSASIDGVNAINATGNVRIGSGIYVNNVNTNGDVVLTGSASISQIKARGNVQISGGTSSLSIQNNGITTLAGGTAASVESIGGIRVTGGGVNVSSMKTEGDLLWTGSGGGVSSAKANGNISYAAGNRNPTNLSAGTDVILSGGGATKVVTGRHLTHNATGNVTEAHVGGNLSQTNSGGLTTARVKGNTSMTGSGSLNNLEGEGTLLVNGWQSAGGRVGGAITKTQYWNSSVTVVQVNGLRVNVEAPEVVDLQEVPEVTVPARPTIDVYALKEAANYAFEYVGGRTQVTVKAVSGIPDGVYVLGNRYANYNTYPDYLCRPADMNGPTCSVPVATLCQGFSPQNACFAYANGKWTVNGASMARGIAWFSGNLEVGNGVYVNTFLATGNINTAGGHRTTSPNYAGYRVTCQNQPPANSSLSINANFQALVPTNLCGNAEMVGNTLANAAFIAGGYSPTTGAFTGGVITLGASTLAEGSVLGADVVNTGGSTVIKGSVVAAAQDEGRTGPVTFSGSTTIDLTGGSVYYDPTVIPCMANCQTPGTGEDETAADSTSAIRWVRYR